MIAKHIKEHFDALINMIPEKKKRELRIVLDRLLRDAAIAAAAAAAKQAVEKKSR